ncbi:MAG: helix-turn-helix transcriptional regulator [Bacilli bacterium]|nr:helix-turn-helix transcriptional regulator [Bacilli bacterium]
MEFSKKLNHLRKTHGLSQEELGERINVTRQTISNWESGLSTPDMDSIIALAKEFSITTDELLSYENDAPIIHIESKGNNTYGLHFSPFAGWHYEYKSKTMVGNLPLVHINFGLGHHVAKGVFAFGNIALGLCSFGFLSLGLFSFGLLALGLLSLGTLALGAVAAGSIAIGLLAFGGISLGVISYGAVSCGVYSIGAASVGGQIAYGAKASAPVAFSTDNGLIEFTKEEIAAAIDAKYPDLWEFIKWLFVSLGK